jgi:cysteine-rich repeat protein
MKGYYQCDDGNNVNGDGCDEHCNVELCWDCDGLSPTTCGILPINTIGILNATMAQNQSLVTMFFNNSIVL